MTQISGWFLQEVWSLGYKTELEVDEVVNNARQSRE